MASPEYVQRLRESGWPQEFGEKLIIGNLESNVGIATLWTFKEVVSKHLSSGSYAVIGNFYDKQNALEPFIRNCLANPNIRYVFLLGNDKSGSKQVLINFFELGLKDGKVVDTDTVLPRSIPVEDIEDLRRHVKLIDLSSKIADANNAEDYGKTLNEALSLIEKKEPYREPQLYDKPVLKTESYPGEKAGFMLRGKTVGEVWLRLLREIYDYGAVTKMKTSDSTQVRECINLMAVVEAEDADVPVMYPFFRFDEAYLKSYYDEICSDRVPEGTLYTYGSRFRAWLSPDGEKIDQIVDMIEYLKKDTYRKSALAQTWIIEDELTRRYLNKDKNSPCIILVQPNIQDGVLHLTTYIRSNDMFRAWPLNAFGLRKLQKIIAQGVGADVGTLTTISCSAHIYQDNWEDTKKILDEHYTNTNCFFDPRGYYVISLKKGTISADHYSPQSQLLKQYEGKTARELNDAINSSQHTLDSYHASYLGEELMKAEIALRLGVSYTQDLPLELGAVKDACAVDGDVCSTDSCAVDGDSCGVDGKDSCAI